jgi:hypothetical protein
MPMVKRPRDPAQIQRWLDRIRVGGLTPGLADIAVEDGTTFAAAQSYLRRWHLDELEEARRDYLIGTRGSGGPVEVETKDGYTRLFQPKFGKAKFLLDLAQLRDDLLADLKAARPISPPALKPVSDGLLHVVSPADLHIGKLSWAPETGEDYDSGIASTRLKAAIANLLDHARRYPVAQHLLVVGNDLLNVDNLMASTTGLTQQDVDSRYRKMFRLAVRLMRECADMLAESAPVSVLVVPGNHDTLASFHVGEVLGAIYDGHRRVAVSADIRPRLYYQHGRTLLGFCHGNEEKHPDLPLIMAQEAPGWGQTTYREFLVGHLHKKRERAFTAGDSYNGVRVVVLPSLTGTDAWHSRKGYIGEPKASESRLYCPKDGLVATFTARVA